MPLFLQRIILVQTVKIVPLKVFVIMDSVPLIMYMENGRGIQTTPLVIVVQKS